jgi:hypothetical protein
LNGAFLGAFLLGCSTVAGAAAVVVAIDASSS